MKTQNTGVQANEIEPPSQPSFAITALGGTIAIDYIVIYGYGS